MDQTGRLEPRTKYGLLDGEEVEVLNITTDNVLIYKEKGKPTVWAVSLDSVKFQCQQANQK